MGALERQCRRPWANFPDGSLLWRGGALSLACEPPLAHHSTLAISLVFACYSFPSLSPVFPHSARAADWEERGHLAGGLAGRGVGGAGSGRRATGTRFTGNNAHLHWRCLSLRCVLLSLGRLHGEITGACGTCSSSAVPPARSVRSSRPTYSNPPDSSLPLMRAHATRRSETR